jgi:hypothetical protein
MSERETGRLIRPEDAATGKLTTTNEQNACSKALLCTSIYRRDIQHENPDFFLFILVVTSLNYLAFSLKKLQKNKKNI